MDDLLTKAKFAVAIVCMFVVPLGVANVCGWLVCLTPYGHLGLLVFRITLILTLWSLICAVVLLPAKWSGAKPTASCDKSSQRVIVEQMAKFALCGGAVGYVTFGELPHPQPVVGTVILVIFGVVSGYFVGRRIAEIICKDQTP